MKKNGAYLVPTLHGRRLRRSRRQRAGTTSCTPAQSAKALEAGPKMLDMARRAHDAGVKIAFGTDTGVSAHGDNAGEFALLVEGGPDPAGSHPGRDRQRRRPPAGLRPSTGSLTPATPPT